MTFNEHDHPRGTAGKFTEKQQSPDEVTVTAPALTQPEGYDSGWGALRSAASFAGERLEESDGINCRAEYAEVGDDGIAYGYTVGPELVGSIVTGDRGMFEDESEYSARVDEALANAGIDQQQIWDYFQKRYGADARWDGDAGHIAVEFYVEYGDAGAAGSSVEAMGDRVENETKLLAARNDYDYGTAMQSHLADHLGYRTDYDTGEYVRDEDGQAR